MIFFRFGRLETRIVKFFVGLLVIVQLAGFISIRYVIEQNARRNLREELNVGERVFKRLLEQKEQQLIAATNVLTRDFAFRSAIATRDRDTIVDVLRNHGARISADRLALVDLQNVVTADTVQPTVIGKPFAFPDLISSAQGKRTVSAIRVVDGSIYQVVIVPVLAPVPIAWVVVGFVIDNSSATELQRLTGLDVTFLGKDDNRPPSIFATTLMPATSAKLQEQSDGVSVTSGASAAILLGDEEFEILATTIDSYQINGVGSRVFVVLQRSVREGVQPYETLK